MKEISDMQAGKAGEHLVCSDLILSGYPAFIVEQPLAYDILVDLSGQLIRIQVKATRRPRKTSGNIDQTPSYLFHIRRMGKYGRGRYSPGDVDIFALVALDTCTIGYVAEKDIKQSMVCRIREYQGLYWEERVRERNEEIIRLRNEGFSFREIAGRLDTDASQACRITKNRQDNKLKSRYLDELTFEKALYAYLG